MLLGGPDEHERNLEIAGETQAFYPGHFALERFMGLVAACDGVITGVKMALHIALGLEKRVVLFDNIFNRHEFELNGRGEILEPSRPCRCYYRSQCDDPCMPTLGVQRVLKTIQRVLPR